MDEKKREMQASQISSVTDPTARDGTGAMTSWNASIGSPHAEGMQHTADVYVNVETNKL